MFYLSSGQPGAKARKREALLFDKFLELTAVAGELNVEISLASFGNLDRSGRFRQIPCRWEESYCVHLAFSFT